MIPRKNTESLFENKWKIMIGLYMILSFIFIVISFYENFKVNYAQANFERGSQFAFAQVIDRANQWCDAFTVNLWESRVNLINVACFQNAQEQNSWWTQQSAQQWTQETTAAPTDTQEVSQ